MVRDVSEREDETREPKDQDTQPPPQYDPTRDFEKQIDEALIGPAGES